MVIAPKGNIRLLISVFLLVTLGKWAFRCRPDRNFGKSPQFLSLTLTQDTTMNTTKIIKSLACLLFGSFFLTLNAAVAESDMQLQEKALKAREMMRHEGMMDHASHSTADASDPNGFRGVFYGYLPCDNKDCDGLKMTLSLKQKNNYLLVTQNAMASTREYYEKGKYDWNEKNHTVTLQPNNNLPAKVLSMVDETALVVLGADGKTLPSDQEAHTLRRSDKSKTRDVHIH